MNGKQYKNIIDNTMKHIDNEIKSDSVKTAIEIFKNRGIEFPDESVEYVKEILSSDNYMSWEHCEVSDLHDYANNGVAVVGIDKDRIVVIAPESDDEAEEKYPNILTYLDLTEEDFENMTFYAATASYYGGGNDNSGTTKPVDTYTKILSTLFGFTPEVANIIISIYGKISDTYRAEPYIKKSWRCARLLGGMHYNGVFYGGDSDSSKEQYKWDDVAGIYSFFPTDEKGYFINTLKCTEYEYSRLKNGILQQHADTSTPDFAHMQISLAARLAYNLGLNGLGSNIYLWASDLDVSYFAGWLGDATLINNGTTSLGNDDYCADLDAENIYNMIKPYNGYGTSLQYSLPTVSFNTYYESLSSTTTRADLFLNNIDYETVKNKIFSRLAPNETDPMAKIRLSYHDTYNFLRSLQDRSHTLKNY